MNSLIRDLIQFEEVEEVIKLRQEEKAREYVEKYVISDSLRTNLLHMLDMLCSPTHKSFNVVGNYGTGKSHFLAFVAALLEQPDLRGLVRDEAVRSSVEGLDRKYLVVKFELGAAADTSLRHIFFDQVRQQLLDRYDIEVPEIDLVDDYDNKQNLLDIQAAIKAQDPEAGLVVIVDEISDFLKQKPKTAMAYDLALLRELGEVSQDSDFLYIGAMQEHVFTNPKYVDQAESIARINQRFVTITITKEDVAQVLSERVVRKNSDQRLQLEMTLDDHRKYFPNLAQQFERYVNLFPLHPYVIDVFERLPYFENRGIIGFAVNNVRPILDLPAPVFITYDRVFDLIDATHEIRNQPDVARVVDIAHTLLSKTELLDVRYRDDAAKLIKALTVLRLLGDEHAHGATSQELANTLLITPPGRLLVEPRMARDNIERIMKAIRDVTVGQYIAYGDGRYSIDLTKITDYDAVIEKKAQAAVAGNDSEIEYAFRTIAEAELGLKDRQSLVAGVSVYADTAPWPSRRAFRPGLIVIGKRDDGRNLQSGDYRFVLQGPVPGRNGQRQNDVVMAVDFDERLIALLTRARAAELLAQEGVYRKVMTKLSREAATEFVDRYLALLNSGGIVIHGGHTTNLNKITATRSLNTLTDIVDHVKGNVLDPIFAERYPSFPVFRTLVTSANLEGEMARALRSLDRVTSQQLDLNSRGYLESFGAIADGSFRASSSEACQLILKRVEANEAAGSAIALDDVVREFAQAPWGLYRELVYLLLGALLFNGYLIFVRHGGARLHAGDVGPLLKQGLEFFDTIRYLERDPDIDAEGAAALFGILDLQPGLVRYRDSRTEAVKALRQRGLDLREQLAALQRGMEPVITGAADFPDVPWLAIQERRSRLAELQKPVAAFASASKVSDLGALDTSSAFRETLKSRLHDLGTLLAFLDDWQEQRLGSKLKRMQDALRVLPELEALAGSADQATVSELRRIADDSRTIASDERKLLSSETRLPLKGKLTQFHQKYDQLYYRLHQRLVGDEAPWAQLDAVGNSQRYRSLNRLKGLPFISFAEFNSLALNLQALRRRQCEQFNAEVLDSFVTCPYCRFPDGVDASHNLQKQASELESRLEELWDRWQAQVFNELPSFTDRLSLLSSDHQQAIRDLEQKGRLPDDVSPDLLEALLELTSDLQPVDLDLDDLARHILSKSSPLTVDELRDSWEDYIRQLLKGRDPELVRIRVVLPKSGG